METMNKYRPYLWGVAIGFVCTVVVTWSILMHLGQPYGLAHGDAFIHQFILQHYMDVVFHGTWRSITTLPMFYGYPNSLFFADHDLMFAVLILPFYLITHNIITSFELLSVCMLWLSFVSMYVFVYWMTKRVWGSAIAAGIFVFASPVFIHFPDQLVLFSVLFIPMIFLFFERSLVRPTAISHILFFTALTCQILASLYYAVFLALILPIYAVIRMRQTNTRPGSWLTWGSMLGFVLFLSVAAWSAYTYMRAFPSGGRLASEAQIGILFSPLASDYLLPDTRSILGGLKPVLAGILPQVVRVDLAAEQYLWWGIVAAGVFILSFRLNKRTWKDRWTAWIIMVVVTCIYSFGPHIHLTQTMTIPNVYTLLTRVAPIFSYPRVPSRISIFTIFFVAAIVGCSWGEIEKSIRERRIWMLRLAVIVLLLLEYGIWSTDFTVIDRQTMQLFKTLRMQRNIHVIVDLPAANDLFPSAPGRGMDDDGRYLLWAIFHGKTLLEGNSGIVPPTYFQRMDMLSVNFPTQQKLEQLRVWGVDGILVHTGEYPTPSMAQLTVKGLDSLGVPRIAETPTLILYNLGKWGNPL
jgi:hypothetical protein